MSRWNHPEDDDMLPDQSCSRGTKFFGTALNCRMICDRSQNSSPASKLSKEATDDEGSIALIERPSTLDRTRGCA
jgi:hypothetical protein